MMRHNPARAARREEEAFEQAPEELRCLYCGNTDPLLIRPRRIQNHHLFGEDRDEATVPACLNCHAGAHEALTDSEVPMTCEQSRTKFAAALFRVLAVHFSMLAEACKRFARRMR